jgi:hypothetical protein
MGMTKTGTLKEDPTECYFCKGAPTHVKREATLLETETASGEVLPDTEEIELLPVCEDCNEENYDGTEAYPALLPLSTIAGMVRA